MTPKQFVAKWSQIQQKETAVSQSHFNDICRLVGHPTPLEYDPAGTTFSFETQTVKPGGRKGFADVYFRGKFIWEYKEPHAGLGDAYDKMVKKRTLTNLYNGLVYYRQTVKAGELFVQAEFDKVTRQSVSRAQIQELDDIHTQLDTAVLDAYGWRHDLSDEEILEHLLSLNLQRAAAQD